MRPFAPLLAGLLLAGSAYAAEPAQAPAAPVEQPQVAAPDPDLSTAPQARPGDRVMGRADAPVTIVEYASLTCPHCAHFHEETLPALKAKYIDTGKVRFIFRDFPLDRGALVGAVVARCIPDNAKSLAFVADLFASQSVWIRANDIFKSMQEKAAAQGLDADTFHRCVETDQEKNIRTVVEIAKEGQEKFGIDATPSFIVGGKRISGGLTLEEFDEVLQPLVK